MHPGRSRARLRCRLQEASCSRRASSFASSGSWACSSPRSSTKPRKPGRPRSRSSSRSSSLSWPIRTFTSVRRCRKQQPRPPRANLTYASHCAAGLGGQFVNRYTFDKLTEGDEDKRDQVNPTFTTPVEGADDIVTRRSWMSIVNFEHPAASFTSPSTEADASKISAGKCGDKWHAGALPKAPHPTLPQPVLRPRGLRASSAGSSPSEPQDRSSGIPNHWSLS